MSLNVTSNIGVIGYNISNEIVDRFVAIGYNYDSDYQLTSGNDVVYSTDGINWIESTISDTPRDWRSVCYGNGKFVAITGYNSNYFAYSTDGITWTESTISSTSRNWQYVCYGNGKFVTIARNTNYFAYSTDGITWTEGTISSTSRNWVSVCYGNGKFVIITGGDDGGYLSYFAYSTDGITWTEGTISNSSVRNWLSICYGNAMFIIVGYTYKSGMGGCVSGNNFAYSTDGITWTEGAISSSAIMWDYVCYGNGKFVAVAYNSFAYSTDGTNWTKGSISSTGREWYSVCYGNGKFVAVANDDNYFAYSTDGINWTESTISDTSRRWQSVCYASLNLLIPTSEKAFNLSQPENASTTEFEDKVILDSIVHHDSPMYLLINQKATNNNFYIHSPILGDITLTGSDRKIYPVDSNMNRNCIGGKLHPLGDGYVAYSIYSNNMDATSKLSDSDTGSLELITGVIKANPYLGYYKSVNGTNFYGIENDEDGFMKPYKDLNPTFVVGELFVVSNYGNTITTGPNTHTIYSMCYGNGLYVGAAETRMVYSTDGINWAEGTISNTSREWRSVCYGNGVFLASGYNTSIYMYSVDGINWTEYTIDSSALNNCGYLSFANDRFFTVMSSWGYSYSGYTTFAYSFDGINWTKGNFGARSAWKSVCYGNGKFVAIATSDYKDFAYSSDGINWKTGLFSDKNIGHICYGNGMFVAVTWNSDYFIYSTDGINWTQSSIGVDNTTLYDIIYADDMYIISARRGTNSINYKNVLFYSKNLVDWNEIVVNVRSAPYCMCYNSPVIEFSNNHAGISTDVTDVNGISSMITYTEQYTEDIYYIHYAWVDRASSSLVRYNILTRKIDTSSGIPVISNVASYTTTFSIGTVAHPSFHKDKNGIHCAFYHGNTTYTKYYKLTRSGTDDSTWSWDVDSNTYITNENISLMVNKNENNLQSSVAQSARRMYMVNSSDNLVEFKKTQTF